MLEYMSVCQITGIDFCLFTVVVGCYDGVPHGSVDVNEADRLHGQDDEDHVEEEVDHQRVQVPDSIHEQCWQEKCDEDCDGVDCVGSLNI